MNWFNSGKQVTNLVHGKKILYIYSCLNPKGDSFLAKRVEQSSSKSWWVADFMGFWSNVHTLCCNPCRRKTILQLDSNWSAGRTLIGPATYTPYIHTQRLVWSGLVGTQETPQDPPLSLARNPINAHYSSCPARTGGPIST